MYQRAPAPPAPAVKPAPVQATGVDFAVPTHYTIGERFPAWADAVAHALGTIRRFEYPGQAARPDVPGFHPRSHVQEGPVLVVYSRAFVQMRVTEPVQERAGAAGPYGQDGVAFTWEIFHDGTAETMTS